MDQTSADTAGRAVITTARKAFDAFAHGAATGDFANFLGMLTPDFTFQVPIGAPGKNSGPDRMAAFLDVFRSTGAHLVYEEPFRILQTGETVVFEYEDSGVLLGRPYHNRIAFSLDVRGDQLAAFREYWGEIDPALVAELAGQVGVDKERVNGA